MPELIRIISAGTHAGERRRAPFQCSSSLLMTFRCEPPVNRRLQAVESRWGLRMGIVGLSSPSKRSDLFCRRSGSAPTML
jgi:hypothetical protein